MNGLSIAEQEAVRMYRGTSSQILALFILQRRPRRDTLRTEMDELNDILDAVRDARRSW